MSAGIHERPTDGSRELQCLCRIYSSCLSSPSYVQPYAQSPEEVAMPGDLLPLLVLLLLCVQAVSGASKSQGCLADPTAAYRYTGAVCRLTYPAAVVLNEKTTKVIEAAFQHARYPKITREKDILLIGTVKYGLDNLEIHNLSIGQSVFELRPPDGIGMKISNVSAVFRGTIHKRIDTWLVNVAHSIDFEIESQIDLGINPKLYCGVGKVAADTSDCYLEFHKLNLQLQGDRNPNWLKKLLTDFISFTVKLVIKNQICKEINKVANILSDFVQETAEAFLSDGNISMDIGVTAAPVVTTNYIESYHKGLTNYNSISAVINESVFNPSQLTEHRMLYFWISDQMLNPVIAAAHQDERFHLNVSGTEIIELFKKNLVIPAPAFIEQCLVESVPPELRVWSSSVPLLKTSPRGSSVRTQVSGELHCGNPPTPILTFQMGVEVVVTASYSDKKLFLHDTVQQEYLREAVEKIGIPKILSVLEQELTRLLDKQGANMFDIVNPEVLPHNGFVVVQMDFGFPHHLLVEFLRKTLQ
ncbi:Cholesteryl ester transfer protein [Merluccius polli]|uniref:Cholesteryl ester transfer protein n=1 Tax=Merluccius polli TaxID=89951 RepID=A0AA47MKT5_MERPO|nr:Cholesteryl ester transfer protein [Merluccius polli]